MKITAGDDAESLTLHHDGGTSPEETKVLRFRDLPFEERRRRLPPKNRLFQMFSVRVEYDVDKPGKLSGYISALDRTEALKDGWVGVDSESGCQQVCLFDCTDESIPIVNRGCLPLTDPSCSSALPATNTLELISDFILTFDDEDELDVSNSHITVGFSDFNSVLLFGTCKSFTTKRLDG